MASIRKKYTRWNIDLVKEFVEGEDGNGCKLVSEDYKNIKTTMFFLCCCGNTFEATWDSFINQSKRQCNKCSGLERKTTEAFKKEVFDLEGGNYCVVGDYINDKTKVKIKHVKCGHTYSVRRNNFINGTRCPQCYGTPKKTHSEFISEIYNLVENDYKVVGRYSSAKDKVKFKHTHCGYIYSVTPDDFLSGRRCPRCYGKHLKTTSEFKNEVYGLVGNEYEVAGEYINARTHISLKHIVCGEIYNVTPDQFLRGTRCVKCSDKISKGEKEIGLCLDNMKIKYETETTLDGCSDVNKLRFDFSICDELGIKYLIEFDGHQHFKPVRFGGISIEGAEESYKNTIRRDSIKTQYCKDNNIPLLRIPYWEFDNIETILHSWLVKHGLIERSDVVLEEVV